LHRRHQGSKKAPWCFFQRAGRPEPFPAGERLSGKSDQLPFCKEENAMKKRIAFAVIIILTMLLAACAPKSYSQEAPAAAPAPGLVEGYTTDSGAPAYDQTYTEQKGFGGNASSTAAQERLVIMNAYLTIVIADPQAKMEAISAMAQEMGGFVVSMDMGQAYTASGESVPQGSISIRVPADQLDSAIKQIKAGVVEVQNENRSGEDVTAQYTDLSSQLKNLEQAEEDLLAIMDEAKNNPNSSTSSQTQDVLSVYNQIVSIRGQIEQIKGQMQYYEQSAAYSLINVTLIAEKTIQPIQVGGWKPVGVARDAIQALVKFLQGFVDFIIRLVLYVLPMLIVIFGPIALVVWLIVRGVKKNKAKKAKANG
jgi:hypothetical protein